MAKGDQGALTAKGAERLNRRIDDIESKIAGLKTGAEKDLNLLRELVKELTEKPNTGATTKKKGTAKGTAKKTAKRR